MGKSINGNKRCSGCGVCATVCPKHAISFSQDNKGFSRPVVNENCIDCGICVKKCHENKTTFLGDKIKAAYTAYSKNESIRNVSSSGGIFSEIALTVLADDGFVCGVAFDKDFHLCHQIIDKVDKLDGLRQSKYIESDITRIWEQIKERALIKQQKGLFVGTPCQCSALRSYLGNQTNNLLICDFICHGVASPLVFKKFKEFLESRYGSPLKIEFRHKENGEGSYFYYEGTTGTYMIPNYKKSYPYAFASGLIIAEDCTDCNYCTLNRFGDITLGDYVSGVTDYSKSTIFANTQKGMDFINRCQSIILKEENLQDVTAKSWHLTTANTFNPQREEVFTNIDKSWEYLEKKYFHLPSWSQRYKQALLNKFKKVNKL